MTHADFIKKFPPSCPSGYSGVDLERYFGAKSGEPHPLWTQLRGQTGSICTGKNCDESHGFISYVGDVHEWYEGLPVSDW